MKSAYDYIKKREEAFRNKFTKNLLLFFILRMVTPYTIADTNLLVISLGLVIAVPITAAYAPHLKT